MSSDFSPLFSKECILCHMFQWSLCSLVFVRLVYLVSFYWIPGATTTTRHLFLSLLFRYMLDLSANMQTLSQACSDVEMSLGWEGKFFSGLSWTCVLPLVCVRFSESLLIQGAVDYSGVQNKTTTTAMTTAPCLSWLFSPGLGGVYLPELSPCPLHTVLEPFPPLFSLGELWARLGRDRHSCSVEQTHTVIASRAGDAAFANRPKPHTGNVGAAFKSCSPPPEWQGKWKQVSRCGWLLFSWFNIIFVARNLWPLFIFLEM